VKFQIESDHLDHGIRTSDATVHRVCNRYGLNRLPNRVGRRAVHTHHYEKQVPGHHLLVDVKFLMLKRKNGTSVQRYQYTAIDDATRARVLKICRRHTQANAIDFINYVVDKFPFRIRTNRTDKGEFYRLLTYRDDVNLAKKLAEWERFYDLDRPHGAHRGKTPYESLRDKRS